MPESWDWVSSDVLMTLYFDLPPAARGLVRDEEELLRQFPPDYIEQLRGDLQRRHEEMLKKKTP